MAEEVTDRDIYAIGLDKYPPNTIGEYLSPQGLRPEEFKEPYHFEIDYQQLITNSERKICKSLERPHPRIGRPNRNKVMVNNDRRFRHQ